MRVCYVSNLGWPAGGAETSIELLRAELAQRGHQVRTVTTDMGAAGRSDVFADALIPHITGGPLRRLRHYFFDPTAYRYLRRFFQSFRPDIVHFHTIGELSPAALLAARGIPFVMTVHGPEDFTQALIPWHLPPSDYRNGTYRRHDLRHVGRLRALYLWCLQRPAYLFGLRRCGALIAPSGFIARVLADDVDPRRVVQIDNGIDLPDPAPPPGKGRFLFLGRLEAVKGVGVLLRAFAHARDRCPGITLVIAGGGPQREALEALSVELGIGKDVTFLGRVGRDDVVRALADCDALVVPSVWPEAFGLVVVEAMGVGRAVLGCRVGAIPDLVADGVSGLIVEPDDEHALADGLVRLASQPDLCRDMGEAGRRGAMAYTANDFVNNTLALYDKALATAS